MTHVGTLRSASLGAFVVAAADQGEYGEIARLTESGVWSGAIGANSHDQLINATASDSDIAIAALLNSSIHDVHCRRGMAAVLTGRHATRARALLRSPAFASTFGRLVKDGLLHDKVAARLVRMGAPPKMLAATVMRTADLPEWGIAFLRTLVRESYPSREELIDILLASSRPGAILMLYSDVRGASPEWVFSSRPEAADDAGLLERLAEDDAFMASHVAYWFLRRILYHACCGRERLLGVVEAYLTKKASLASLYWEDREKAARLCREHCPHLVDRVSALPCLGRSEGGGLMRLVEYGAQDIDLIGLGRANLSFATNYNVLRIMSGLGGLRYTR